MSEPIPKCSTCKNEIPVGKYYQLHNEKNKMGDYCSPCWNKEQSSYKFEIENGKFKVIEAERERERERAKSRSSYQVANVNTKIRSLK